MDYIAKQASQVENTGGLLVAALTQGMGDRPKSSEADVVANAGGLGVPIRSGVASPRLTLSIDITKMPSSSDLAKDHHLALALAALCNCIYQILEYQESVSHESFQVIGDTTRLISAPNAVSGPSRSLTSLMLAETPDPSQNSQLEDLALRVSNAQAVRHKIDISRYPAAIQSLWEEIDVLMLHVQNVGHIRSSSAEPPTYEEALRASQVQGPSQDQASVLETKATKSSRTRPDELDRILNVIDRLVAVAPRLVNQTVYLTPEKERIMSAAALAALIEKLVKNRVHYDDQRGVFSPTGKGTTALNILIDQITKSGQRRMSSQRAETTPAFQQKLELGRLSGVVERQSRSRFTNQDWISPETKLLEDLARLNGDLAKSTKQMEDQRYVVSSKKQMEMFVTSVFGKLDRMSERRMQNQDAVSPTDLKSQRFDELDRIMDRMSPSLSNQRSVLRSSSVSKT
ncbi:uncharacterized protein BJ171DRAFT_480403 [Polychytrium aggregatum]|uniref:uncharacterized protein n=1 Tax=Polychytrium aggregatum TaxID=110093 RepID=UPI0022FE8F52|nr:uncharacterized protein BJ171DRAFT_480403 [Polychytrium aggregatum]KAI9193174.1 hypothetical protein BJ171DRAFT_480403 [Polychytrium aggregatum]